MFLRPDYFYKYHLNSPVNLARKKLYVASVKLLKGQVWYTNQKSSTNEMESLLKEGMGAMTTTPENVALCTAVRFIVTGRSQKTGFVEVARRYTLNIHLDWDLYNLKWETENWEQDQS